MFKGYGDQAAGLRRLLTRDGMRVVAFDAGCRGVGSTTATINVGAALAEAGRKVLLIDANGGDKGIATLLGLQPRLDLRNATRRECTIDEVLIQGPGGLTVLPAGEGAHGLPALRQLEEQCLIQHFDRLGDHFDFALIDSHDQRQSRLLGRTVRDIVVVASAAASSVTGAYSIVKRAARYSGHMRFHVMMNDVSIPQVARLICANIQRAASRYLEIEVADLGWVPQDDKVRLAASRRQAVMNAFPMSAAASGFERIATAIAGWPGYRLREHKSAVNMPVISGNHERAAYAAS